MIRLYKNLKRSPWNRQIDDMGSKTCFHTSQNINPLFNMYPGSEVKNSSAIHFQDHSILFETKADLEGMIRILQESLKDM